MVPVSIHGQTAATMTVIGKRTKPMVKANFSILMGMFIRDSGVMIWPMGKVCINTAEVLNTMVNGKTISKMVMVFRHGLTALVIRETI